MVYPKYEVLAGFTAHESSPGLDGKTLFHHIPKGTTLVMTYSDMYSCDYTPEGKELRYEINISNELANLITKEIK